MAETYTLYDLNQQLRRVVALNFANALWIKCELAQVNLSRGQYYLSLVQKSEETEEVIATANAILWYRKYNALRRKLGRELEAVLQGGMEVLIQVRVEFDERWGLSLHVDDIDPAYTLGQLEMQRQQTIAVLEKAKLLDLNRQNRLPNVVQRIAVISSLNAAGYQDFLQQLEQNSYGYQYFTQLFPAAMQGVAVEKEVLTQLKKIRRGSRPFSAVVIIRGGGAKLDLAAFNSLELSKAVAQFFIPVLTGIGHDVDETVLDMVAHTSLKTPTAVADFLINRSLHFESTIQQLGLRVQQLAGAHIRAQDNYLQRILENLRLQSQLPLQEHQQNLQQLENMLPQLVQNRLQKEQRELDHLEKLTKLLSPEAALKRGFALLRKKATFVHSIEELEIGDELEIELKDGTIQTKIVQ